MFVDDVGGGRSIVEIDAGRYARGNRIGRPRGNIAGRRKGKKTTGSMNKSEGKKNNKTVVDEGTTPQKTCDIEHPQRLGNRPRCRFCGLSGIVVAQFSRRAYEGKVFSEEVGLGGKRYF